VNVYFQRGTSNDERGYRLDLSNTILRPVTREAQGDVVSCLQSAGKTEDAAALSAIPSLWMWGGPGGVSKTIEAMAPGDLNLFILDGLFKAACRIFRRLDLNGETSSKIASRIWQKHTYPEIWAIDISFSIPDIDRGRIAVELGKDERFFVQGRGALFPHQRVNIAPLPATWFEEADRGGVERLLQLLQLGDADIRLLMSR
jgi:hypothetical protein